MTLNTTLQTLFEQRPDLRGVTDPRVLADALTAVGDTAGATLVRSADVDALQAAFQNWFATAAATPASLNDASRIKHHKNPNTGATTQFSWFEQVLRRWGHPPVDTSATGEVRLSAQGPSLAVPREIADRINERLAHLSHPSSNAARLDEELRNANCYGAVLCVLYGGKAVARRFFEPSEMHMVSSGVYHDYDALAAQLRDMKTPVALVLGEHGHHVVLFLGFAADGVGIVFHKGNAAANRPWELRPLREIHQRYVTGGYNDGMVALGVPR